MKDKLKKGQAFIGIDDNKYYFLGYDYDGQIMFTDLYLWTDKNQKYVVKNNLFIKEVLDEKSDVIENCTWYYQSLEELEESSMNEKIKRCLDIIENSNTDEITLKPTRIGAYVRGQAYSKEFNQYYEVIGFIVENHLYLDGNLKSRQKGFFPIYHSNCEESVPLIFERCDRNIDNSFNAKNFMSSNDDKADVTEIIASRELVNSYLDENLMERFEHNFYDDRAL